MLPVVKTSSTKRTVLLRTSAHLDAAKAFLAEAEKGKRTDRDINARLAEVTQEGEKLLLFETLDREQKNACLRRSYLAR